MLKSATRFNVRSWDFCRRTYMSNPYSTHQNMLRKCIEATTGPVLELGVGEGSTPLIHELCAMKGRQVVSYDTDSVFFEMYRDRYQSALHEFNYIHHDDWDSAVIVRPDKPWSVVLVDHRPARRRQVEAGRVATMAEYVVCHDTEPENDRFYRWNRAFAKFRHRYDDTSQMPQTTVLSNFNDLTFLRDTRTHPLVKSSGGPDLTVVFYTANVIHEPFAGYVRDNLVKSIRGRYPLISVSQKPMPDFGRNVCVGEIGRSHLNLYRAVLRGAQEAQTAFVGLAEDDVMYSDSHWDTRRPPAHKFSYDVNGWGLNSWVRPAIFGYRNRKVINRLIAPRDLLVDALEERFAKFKLVPDDQVPLKFWGDLGRYENHLGVTVRETETFAAPEPSIIFSHDEAFGFLSRGERKSTGEGLRDYLYPWGKSESMLGLWLEGYKR